MSTHNIQSHPSGYRIILIPDKVSIFVKGILGILTFLTITAPIIILFSANVSPGAIIGAIVSILCFIVLLRLFLWNALGTEVFELESEEIRHYTDYKYFKDELFRSKAGKGITVEYVSSIKNQKHETEEYLLAFFEHGKEVSLGNVKLTLDQVRSILDEVELF